MTLYQQFTQLYYAALKDSSVKALAIRTGISRQDWFRLSRSEESFNSFRVRRVVEVIEALGGKVKICLVAKSTSENSESVQNCSTN